jgi:archaellum component FlaC
MDDITNKRFDDLEKKVSDVEARLGRRVEGLSSEVQGLASDVRGGFAAVQEQLRTSFEDVAQRLGAVAHKHHAEQMSRFQTVIEHAEGLGRKLGKLDEHIEGREAKRVDELEARITKLEALLSAATKQ